MPDVTHSRVQRLAIGVATVGGVGLIRPAPGTWGSVAAMAIGGLVLAFVPAGLLTITFAGLIGLSCLLAWWSVPRAVAAFGVQDPGAVVIDEAAGVWLALALVPAETLHAAPIAAVVIAGVLFRVFDIAKPWPVNWFERLPGVLGIMADDLAAGMIAGALTAALLH